MKKAKQARRNRRRSRCNRSALGRRAVIFSSSHRNIETRLNETGWRGSFNVRPVCARSELLGASRVKIYGDNIIKMWAIRFILLGV